MQMNSQKPLDFFPAENYNIFCRSGTLCPVDDAELCKGSTNDSDSFSPGSNPGSAASICRHGQAVKTSPSHGENRGSSPRGGAEKSRASDFFLLYVHFFLRLSSLFGLFVKCWGATSGREGFWP